MLFIVPSLFALSYTSSATLATEYETHEDSITSFSETIPDDMLYYPDTDSDNVNYYSVDDYEYAYGESSDSSLTVKYNSYSAINTATTTEYDASVPIVPDDSFVMSYGQVSPASFGFSVSVELNYTVPIGTDTFEASYAGTLSGSDMASNNGTLGGLWEVYFYNYQTEQAV